jgi:hypothetical protein
VSGAPDRRVGELYTRYKHLALATGAALVLDGPRSGLESDAARLVEDARAAAAEPGAHATQLVACVDAAVALSSLIAGGGDVEPSRRAHRRLRREVWKVIPCEYVPCCAPAGHGHG